MLGYAGGMGQNEGSPLLNKCLPHPSPSPPSSSSSLLISPIEQEQQSDGMDTSTYDMRNKFGIRALIASLLVASILGLSLTFKTPSFLGGGEIISMHLQKRQSPHDKQKSDEVFISKQHQGIIDLDTEMEERCPIDNSQVQKKMCEGKFINLLTPANEHGHWPEGLSWTLLQETSEMNGKSSLFVESGPGKNSRKCRR